MGQAEAAGYNGVPLASSDEPRPSPQNEGLWGLALKASPVLCSALQIASC